MNATARVNSAHTVPRTIRSRVQFSEIKAILRGHGASTVVEQIPSAANEAALDIFSGLEELTQSADICSHRSPQEAPISFYRDTLVGHVRYAPATTNFWSATTSNAISPYQPLGSTAALASVPAAGPFVPGVSGPTVGAAYGPIYSSLISVTLRQSHLYPARLDQWDWDPSECIPSVWLQRSQAAHLVYSIGEAIVPLSWTFSEMLSQWALAKGVHDSLLRQVTSLLEDEEDLDALGIVPSRISFAHLVKYFAAAKEVKPPTLTMADSGVFITIWQPKPRLRMTFEFRDDGRIRWIFTDAARQGKPLTGAGFITPEKVDDLVKAYDFRQWMTS